MAGVAGIDPTVIVLLRRIGPRMLLEVAWSLLSGRRRSAAADARRALARLDRPLRIEGEDFIPAREPFALVANHYQAPGLWIPWIAAAISDAVARAREPQVRELHWLVLSEWRWFQLGPWWVANPVTSLLFPRACQTWGLVGVPARTSDVAGRAAGLRRAFTYLGLRADRQTYTAEPIGLFPEGRATIALAEARPGSGAFLHRVSMLEVPVLPVGVHQEGNTLVVRFGPAFLLGQAPVTRQDELDRWARERVMSAIGHLLPREMWGAYAETMAGEDGRLPDS